MNVSQDVEPVTVDEIIHLASWERQRSNDELRAFVDRRHNALSDDDMFDLTLEAV